MFKFAILICVVLVVNCETEKTTITFPPEVQAAVWKALNKCCANKEQIRDLIDLVRKGGTRHDEDFKTIVHCVWKESGYITDDGRLIIDKAAAAFPDKETMKKILMECDKDMTQIPKENVYRAYNCFQDTSIYRMSIVES